MNSPLRRFFHRRIEFPLFRLVGLRVEGQDVLEVGCGTGYGAELLAKLGPRSYLGVDLMPEMIELANPTFARSVWPSTSDYEYSHSESIAFRRNRGTPRANRGQSRLDGSGSLGFTPYFRRRARPQGHPPKVTTNSMA